MKWKGEHSTKGVLGLLALLFFGYFIMLLVRRNFAELVALLIPDDAGYYLQVAWNIAHGHGSTFDGLNLTNGYHPLWMLILIPVYACCSSVESAFQLFIVVSLLLVLASEGIIFLIFRRVGASLVATVAGWSVLLLAVCHIGFGMESYIAALTFFCAIWVSSDYERRPSWRTAGLFSLFLGWFFLARLDNVLYILVIGVYFAAKRVLSVRLINWRSTVLELCALAVPLAFLAGGFFVWNLCSFGHLMTISSTLKSVFPHINTSLQHFSLMRYVSVPFALVVSTLVAFLSRQPPLRALAKVTVLWSCGGLVQFLFLLLFQRGIYGWYWINQYVLLSITVGLLILWLEERFPSVCGRFLAGCMGGALFVFTSVRVLHAYNITGPVTLNSDYVAACWAKTNTPATSRFGLSWCGVFGHFADRKVVNLDGVINGYDYVKYIEQGAFARYLRDMRINYLVWDAYVPPDVADGTYEHYKFEPIFHTAIDSNNYVIVSRADEVYRTPFLGNAPRGSTTRWLIIWKFP